jgi:hypothetical protein
VRAEAGQLCYDDDRQNRMHRLQILAWQVPVYALIDRVGENGKAVMTLTRRKPCHAGNGWYGGLVHMKVAALRFEDHRKVQEPVDQDHGQLPEGVSSAKKRWKSSCDSEQQQFQPRFVSSVMSFWHAD